MGKKITVGELKSLVKEILKEELSKDKKGGRFKLSEVGKKVLGEI